MSSDRPSRVHGRAVVHTEGEKGAVRVQKEGRIAHRRGKKERCVCKRRPRCTPRERVGAGGRVKKEAAGKGSFLEML